MTVVIVTVATVTVVTVTVVTVTVVTVTVVKLVTVVIVKIATVGLVRFFSHNLSFQVLSHLNTLTTDHSQGSFSQFLRCFNWTPLHFPLQNPYINSGILYLDISEGFQLKKSPCIS